MMLIGLGMGLLASQLGAVTVSAEPTSQSGDVGGLRNTATNLGASFGIALAWSDAQLRDALAEADAAPSLTEAVISDNRTARVNALDGALGVLALIAVVAMLLTRRIPSEPDGSDTGSDTDGT